MVLKFKLAIYTNNFMVVYLDRFTKQSRQPDCLSPSPIHYAENPK